MAHEAPLGSVQQAWVKLSARINGLGDALPNPTYSHHPAGAARGLVEVACSPQGNLTQEETKITGLPEAFGAKRSKRKGAAAGMAPAPGFGMHCPPLAQRGVWGEIRVACSTRPPQPAERCRGRAQRALDLSLRHFKYNRGKRGIVSEGERISSR